MVRRIGNVNPFVVIKRYGIKGTVVRLARFIGREAAVAGYYRFKCHKAERFQNHTPEELIWIERDLNNAGVVTNDLYVDIDDLKLFKSLMPFPSDYHGGGEERCLG